MTHANDPDEIEAGLERNRSGLATALDELTHRASVDYIAREALGILKVNTADATHSLDRAIRANPVAFTLVGVGLAWMMFGGKSTGANGHDRDWQSQGLHADDPNPEWHSHLGELRDKARAALGQIDHEARSSVQSLKSNLSSQVGEVRDYAAERARVIEDFAADLKAAVADGLEHLSETARARVIQARQESYSALLRAERVVKGGAREAVHVIEEHPVAVGAAALAIGAVAGMALLRSGDTDRNSPSYWTRGKGGGHARDGQGGGAYRGTWAQGSEAGLGGLSGGQGVPPAKATSGMVSTGGAGQASGGGQSAHAPGSTPPRAATGPFGGEDSEGPLPPS